MKSQMLVYHQGYQADDYDEDGNLKAPFWFWVALLWLLCPWWLAAIGIAQKAPLSITVLLYPTLIDNIISLVGGVPVLLMCLIYPIRGKYPQWGQRCYLILIVLDGLVIMYLGAQWLLSATYSSKGDNDLLLGMLCFNLAALLSISFSLRLRRVFVVKNYKYNFTN